MMTMMILAPEQAQEQAQELEQAQGLGQEQANFLTVTKKILSNNISKKLGVSKKDSLQSF